MTKTSHRVSSACHSVCPWLRFTNAVYTGSRIGTRRFSPSVTVPRQIQAKRAPVLQQPIGRPVEEIFVQEDRHPKRDSQHALGDQPGWCRGRDYAGMSGTRAGGSITAAANDSAMGPDIDLQDGGILGAREIGERLTTPRAAALVGRQDLVFDNVREMGIIAALRTGLTALLATRLSWR